jgi:hypothetical protein
VHFKSFGIIDVCLDLVAIYSLSDVNFSYHVLRTYFLRSRKHLQIMKGTGFAVDATTTELIL